MARDVWVVSFYPAGDEGGVGGFNWSPNRDEMEREYERMLTHGDASVVRLVKVAVAADPLASPQEVTDELDADIDRHEMLLPAVKQYVPDGAISVPTGGVLGD